jgi:hypothetical protein
MDGIVTGKENKITRRELAPLALPTTNYTCTYKRSVLGLRKGKPTNNRTMALPILP